MDFSEAGKLAFSFGILVCAPHSLLGGPCAVGKPAGRALGAGGCGLPLRRTACACTSSSPWPMRRGNEPPDECCVVAGLWLRSRWLCPCRGGGTDTSPPVLAAPHGSAGPVIWQKPTQSAPSAKVKLQNTSVSQRSFLMCLLEELCGV